MTKAAFQAAYTDWKLIRTRGVVQIVFELPVEKANEAYDALGGMPTPAAEVWCGIARLKPAMEVAKEPRPPHAASTSPAAGGAHRSFHEMSPAQQAGLLCQESSFGLFLSECHPTTWKEQDHYAPACVRALCGVSSRSQITNENNIWRSLVSEYRAWMRAPEVV